jgi:DNA-binding transcriptional regulator YdaS (Cro superfamily)
MTSSVARHHSPKTSFKIWLRTLGLPRTVGRVKEKPLTARIVRPNPYIRGERRPKLPPALHLRGVSVLERALSFQARVADREIGSRAELARRLGVSRAHITQAMAILDAPAEVVAAIERAEQCGRVVTEGVWRRLLVVDEADALALMAAMER